MAINGLSFDMMSAYNRIGYNSSAPAANEAVKAEEVKPAEQAKQDEAPGVKVNLNFDSIRRRPNANLEDVTRDFRKRDSFAINIDEQSMKSDMDKAVAAMEKDQSLKQYQYFVGDSNVITNDEDGLVFIK